MNTLCVCFHGFVVIHIFFIRRFHLFHVIFSFFICHTPIPVARNSNLAQKAIRMRSLLVTEESSRCRSCPNSFACDSVQP